MSRIVHVISSLGLGGAEVMLDKLTARLPTAGVSVICLTVNGPVGDRIAARGVPVSCLDLGCRRGRITALLRLWRELRRLDPHLVQTWLYHGDLIGGLIARLAGIRRVVWNVRNSGAALDRLPRTTRLIVRLNGLLSCWLPARIVCCSQSARRSHEALGYASGKFVVIPNGFDVSRFRPDFGARAAIRDELGLEPTTALVGFVARFDAQKNHRGFIAAAQAVHRVRPDVAFLLAGRDVDNSNVSLTRWIDEAKLAGSVRLLGERHDIPRITAALDVAVNASFGEGFPNTVGEAMACGVPCVVTDVGDSADIVGPYGRVVPAGDMASLAEQVLGLLALPPNDRERIGSGARHRIAEHYNIDRVAASYRDLYADVLQKAG